MIRSHKIRLYPNNKQTTYFAKACGTSRFAYNWALEEWKRSYEANEKISEGLLRKRLNAIKKEQFPWMLEVTKCAPQLAIKDNLNKAFQNFFAKRAEFPKRHKKGIHDSFSISNDQFSIDNNAIHIPKLGKVILREKLRFEGKIISVTISKTAGKWFAAIQVELPDTIIPIKADNKNQVVGVDLGVKDLAVLSDSSVVTGSKVSRKFEKKLKRLNQELSRRKGAKKDDMKSNNFKKTRNKISRLYSRMANIRTDETHKLTTMLVKNYDLIGIEDLNVKGMMSNHHLARSVADMSFFEFRRQLEYKAQQYGVKIVVADQWFASSKICNRCGHKKADLTLNDRKWKCENCGIELDRDVNAAINLRNYAVSYTVSACGELVH